MNEKLNNVSSNQQGFTLVEIAIVLLIVGILLGYTVALLPKQQELKQYQAADRQMDQIRDAIIGFAQINGRLPCPAATNSNGSESRVAGPPANCSFYGGFIPVNTLGIDGRVNQDGLMLDPWSNPYRYYVSDSDFDGANGDDFVNAGEMRSIGLVDSDADDYIDLDGIYVICDSAGTTTDDECTGANTVFGNPDGAGNYAGAPFVLISHGKNWAETPTGDELENMGGSLSVTDLSMTAGPSTNEYMLKDIAASGETTFVRRPTGFADDFDDIVKWVSPSLLFTKMIEADQLP